LSTPIARAGPTSRLLKRQSLVAPPPPVLSHSLRILDDAMGSPIVHHPTEDVTRFVDITRLNDSSRFATRGDFTMMGDDVTRPLGPDQTAFLGEENPGVKATEALFEEFLTTCSSSESGAAALDSIAEFEQMVGDQVDVLRKLITKVDRARDKYPKTVSVLEGLTNERNTWRLMGKLYNDRLVTCQKDISDIPAPAKNSERQVIERLFQRNADVRQAWIVVDWLERNAQDQEADSLLNQMQYFSDSPVAWENTLSALQRGALGPNMVQEMDPDAPLRTGKQLHSLDQEDETRLVKTLFGCVRCGLLEDGQELCVRVGQSWRAATLEGWRPFHDPNYLTGTDGNGDKLPAEGNKHRDIWKKVAWRMTEDSSMPQYERAVYAALCGNLAQLQPVCPSWEDLVWAGAKCAVDVMVETEIRDVIVKQFEELPPDYWNTPVSMSKVFNEISGKGGAVARESSNPYHVIQKYLILNDWPGLVREMATWVTKAMDPHLLRLISHLVLAHRVLGVNGDTGAEEDILQSYSKYLMGEDKLGLVPWYVSRLPPQIHSPLYSSFLTNINNAEDQKLCLYLGREVGLQMDRIVVSAVSMARSRTKEEMVNSLQWLTHDPDSQAADLILQTNNVIRLLLLDSEVEMARKATDLVPPSVMEIASREWRGDASTLPPTSVKELLALQHYLSAIESFNDWFDHYRRGQPSKPTLGSNPSFTERVAHEQKEKQFLAEMERWRSGQMIQSRQTEERLRAVLTFPGGWLVEDDQDEDENTMDTGDVDSEDTERKNQLIELRKLLVPRSVTLLHSLLHTTGQFAKSVALADLVSSDQYNIYTAFSKQDIKELLSKIRESSLAVMDQGKDPWGYSKQ